MNYKKSLMYLSRFLVVIMCLFFSSLFLREDDTLPFDSGDFTIISDTYSIEEYIDFESRVLFVNDDMEEVQSVIEEVLSIVKEEKPLGAIDLAMSYSIRFADGNFLDFQYKETFNDPVYFRLNGKWLFKMSETLYDILCNKISFVTYKTPTQVVSRLKKVSCIYAASVM